MSDERPDTHALEPAADEEAVRTLLEGAGRRPAVPAEDLAAIRAAARREWEELVGAERRRRRRGALPLALAASLLLAVALGWWWRTRNTAPPAAERLAAVELVMGEARVGQADELTAGEVVRTAEGGRVALRLASGASVRLDEASAVRLASASRLELEEGALYVDSPPGGAGALEIATPFGSVREIGTQFEVRLENGGDPAVRVRVRVREGAVAVARRGGAERVTAGEELALGRDGAVRRGRVQPHDPTWNWVLAAAPAFDIEGATLARYLDWVARETGWRLRYQDAALAELAAGIRLHGTIEEMPPDASVSVVLPGSGLGYRIAGGTLEITR